MQNYVTLTKLSETFEESAWLKIGNVIIEAFDNGGLFWPLHVGSKYLVDLELQQLDPQDPEVIYNTDGKLEQVNDTYEYHLYGHVKNNIFYVGDFKFDFEEFNDYGQYENKYIKFIADRINVEFLKEASDQNNYR